MSPAAVRLPWHTAAEYAVMRLPGLPATKRNINNLAQQQGWRADSARARKRAGNGGGWEYRLDLLPETAQLHYALHVDVSHETPPTDDAHARALWAAYEAAPAHRKADAEKKLKAVRAVDKIRHQGVKAAIAAVGAHQGVPAKTLWNWWRTVKSEPRDLWLPALLAKYRPTAKKKDCDVFWRIFLSDALRFEKPSIRACWRRAVEAAKKQGEPVLSCRQTARRFEALPAGVRAIAREGRDAAKALYPAQRRSKAQLGAMEAVNMDGHKFDVFVRFADGRVGRPMLIAIQDVFSGKFLAWRHAESENRAAVRLVIGDMVETYGAPDAIYLDNGRAFASKWISGGAKTRFRFKVRDEDPQGLLVSLGVAIHWTTPYSGQSKPIERAFRDLCDDIAKHPFCAGAYVGNKPDAKPENYGARAVVFDDFKAFADKQIAAHNAREGRRTPAAKGRSFDRTFAESYENAIVRWPTDAQRHLWLMAAERVKARKGSGEIHLFGNRYWSQELNAFAGQPVTVRFDPDRLHEALKVYDARERLICEAPCVEDVGFDSADAARDHARQRTAYMKSLKEHKAISERMTADQLAALYGDTPATSAPTPAPRAKRLATAAAPAAPAEPDIDTEEFEDAFARGVRRLRLISGGG